MERTLVLVKPDGVQRGLVGEVISRLERRGYRLAAMKLLAISRSQAEKHYAEHRGKDFFEDLVQYITSGPVVAMVVEGANAVAGVRQMMGATDPQQSAPGTIRGDLGLDISRNVVHGSDSLASAEREINLYFDASEICQYTRDVEKWIYS